MAFTARRVVKTGKFVKRFRKQVRGTPAMKMARKALQGVRRIRGIVNSEKKLYDKAASYTIPAAGQIDALSDIGQGDTDATRNGNSILAKGLKYGYRLYANSGINASAARLIIFQDTMSLGTIPSVSDVLENTTAIYGVSSPLNSTATESYRFKVLLDKIFDFSNTGRQSFTDIVNLPVSSHIKYTGTTGTDEGRGMLYSLWISDQAASNYPTVYYNSRLSYYDN